MIVSEAIATEEVTACLLCRVSGQQLYSGLSDRLFGAPGVWHLLVCPLCGLVWLSPRPIPAEIGRVYQTYFTHKQKVGHHWYIPIWEKARRALYAVSVPGYSQLADGRAWRVMGSALAWVPSLRERALLGTMCLTGSGRGKLLDIGCGNGTFLSRMRDAGWEVTGVEPDPAAAKLAQQGLGIPIFSGTLEDAKFADASFDAVTLSHVIEHVYNPVSLLSECRRLLKPNGRVVILTPNLESLGHQVFAASWMALDPPRHLHLFSSKTLQVCCEKAGLHVRFLRTSARMGQLIWQTSDTIRKSGVFRDSALTWSLRFHALAFQAREEIALRNSISAGEELVCLGSTAPADGVERTMPGPRNGQAKR